MKVFFVSILLMIVSLFNSYSQTVKKSKELLCISKETLDFFNTLDSIIISRPNNVMQSSLYTDMMDTKNFIFFDSLYSRKARIEYSALRRKTGLELVGQTYYRLDSQIGIDPDGEDVYSSYVAKLSATLNWNLMQSGLLQKKLKQAQINFANQQLRNKTLKSNIDYLNRIAEFSILDSLSNNIRLILSLRRAVLMQEKQLWIALLDDGQVSPDKVQTCEVRLAAINSQLLEVDADWQNRKLEQDGIYNVSIDTAAFFEALIKNSLDLSNAELGLKIQNLKINSNTYSSNMKFTTFARVSSYLRNEGVFYKPNVDVGVTLSLPIGTGVRETKKAQEIELSIMEQDRKLLREQLLAEAKALFDDFNNVERALTVTNSKRLIGMKYLQLRISTFDNHLDYYNYFDRLNSYDVYLSILQQCYELQQRRDICVMKMSQLLSGYSMLPYITVSEGEVLESDNADFLESYKTMLQIY